MSLPGWVAIEHDVGYDNVAIGSNAIKHDVGYDNVAIGLPDYVNVTGLQREQELRAMVRRGEYGAQTVLDDFIEEITGRRPWGR